MTGDIRSLLQQLTAVMLESAETAEKCAAIDLKLEANDLSEGDRASLIAERDALRTKYERLKAHIDGGRKILGSGGDTEGSA